MTKEKENKLRHPCIPSSQYLRFPDNLLLELGSHPSLHNANDEIISFLLPGTGSYVT